MRESVVVLVNGEVFADEQGSAIPSQHHNTFHFAENLSPLLEKELDILILHGNKPQVGFVLFRSEMASHVIHTVPLDVCGADTQGATGYMLCQTIDNILRAKGKNRKVMSIITQTLVEKPDQSTKRVSKAIGPWFDRDKAETYRQTRGWEIVEEPGRGYQRAVPLLSPLEILEIDGIRQLVQLGIIVVAAGGGGIPVVRNKNGDFEGIEGVVETEKVACMAAEQLQANYLLMVIEKDDKFIMSRLSTENTTHLTLEELDQLLKKEVWHSSSVQAKLTAASEFLHHGGKQVVITTLRKLPAALQGQSGLMIGAKSAGPGIFNG